MRIGDLAAASGLTTKTIRFYEQAGLLPAPPRTAGGYRDYPEQTAARLAFIRDAQGAGLTLAEIRSILALRDNGQAPCAHVAALIDQRLGDIERRLTELTKTRETLRGLARRAAATDPAVCAEDDICTILAPPGTRPAVSALDPGRNRTASGVSEPSGLAPFSQRWPQPQSGAVSAGHTAYTSAKCRAGSGPGTRG